MRTRGLVAAIVACAACMLANVASAQTLTIVDSEQYGEFWGVVEENYGDPYNQTETDDELMSILGSIYYDQPDAGYIQLYRTVLAEILDESTTHVDLRAISSMSGEFGGPVYDVFVEHYQVARATAVVQVISANGVDDVEAAITFNNTVETSGTLVYDPGPYHQAGNEYWGGGASTNSTWIIGPEWSENVPYEEILPPSEGQHIPFNLIVESGSEITIKAQAGHGYSQNTFNVGVGLGFDGGYQVVTHTRIDLAP